MATLLGLYGDTGWVITVVAVALDYAIRAFMPFQYSPASWFVATVVPVTRRSEIKIDKAPKVFAARVGFLFASTSVLVWSVARLRAWSSR